MARCSLTLTRKVDRLQELKRRLPDEVDEIIGECMLIAASLASQLVPVRTGALKGSIRIERVRKLLWKFIAGGTAEVNYEWFVEFGTAFQSSQPYMRPAQQEATRTLIEKLKQLEQRLR